MQSNMHKKATNLGTTSLHPNIITSQLHHILTRAATGAEAAAHKMQVAESTDISDADQAAPMGGGGG